MTAHRSARNWILVVFCLLCPSSNGAEIENINLKEKKFKGLIDKQIKVEYDFN